MNCTAIKLSKGSLTQENLSYDPSYMGFRNRQKQSIVIEVGRVDISGEGSDRKPGTLGMFFLDLHGDTWCVRMYRFMVPCA